MFAPFYRRTGNRETLSQASDAGGAEATALECSRPTKNHLPISQGDTVVQ